MHRLVLRPLQLLAAEADTLAQGGLTAPLPTYETAELTELAERYRAMAESLLDVHSQAVRVEKLAGIGRLAAGVAHEVRNPFGAIATYIEVLQRRGTDPAVTTEMRSAIERIERIVQGLLDYARPGAAGPEASGAEATDLNAAVRTVLGFLDAQGTLRGHQVEVCARAGPATRAGRPPRARAGGRQSAGQRLPGRAAGTDRGRDGDQAPGGRARRRLHAATTGPVPPRRSGTAGPRVLGGATCRRARPGAMLFVADDGPGVPEADRERVFDPFFTTKDPGEGTGLGLAIVARTVHDSGGIVWVDRAREGGAVFKVFLPLAGETDALADR